jgi:hypothetical protein
MRLDRGARADAVRGSRWETEVAQDSLNDGASSMRAINHARHAPAFRAEEDPLAFVGQSMMSSGAPRDWRINCDSCL